MVQLLMSNIISTMAMNCQLEINLISKSQSLVSELAQVNLELGAVIMMMMPRPCTHLCGGDGSA